MCQHQMREIRINRAHIIKLFFVFVILSSFLERVIFANGIHFRSGEICRAVVKNGFDVSENGVEVPVLISFDNKNKYLNKCHIFSNASPDFYRNKAYLYINKIECNGHIMNYSAYVVDKKMDFGISSYPKLYNSKKYLHVVAGTNIKIIFTSDENSKT